MACGMEKVVLGRVGMMKELTLLEKVLVQILIEMLSEKIRTSIGGLNYAVIVLQRAGLTKQQARKALAWREDEKI